MTVTENRDKDGSIEQLGHNVSCQKSIIGSVFSFLSFSVFVVLFFILGIFSGFASAIVHDTSISFTDIYHIVFYVVLEHIKGPISLGVAAALITFISSFIKKNSKNND